MYVCAYICTYVNLHMCVTVCKFTVKQFNCGHAAVRAIKNLNKMRSQQNNGAKRRQSGLQVGKKRNA